MNNRRICADYPTNKPNMVLEVCLSYNKPDKSYWNPDEPQNPYYRLTAMPVKVEPTGTAGITSREYELLGGPGRRMTLTDAPKRFSDKALKEKWDTILQNESVKNMIAVVLTAAELKIDESQPPKMR
jgi:hypothetical protein